MSRRPAFSLGWLKVPDRIDGHIGLETPAELGGDGRGSRTNFEGRIPAKISFLRPVAVMIGLSDLWIVKRVNGTTDR